MPEQIAFRMNLFPGQAREYRRRHDEIFPELSKALKDAGVSDYSIFLDPQSLVDKLQSEGRRHLYIDGGDTIRRFLRAGLIDDMTLTHIPVLLGTGLPLFGAIDHDIPLRLERCRTYDNGFVQTTYGVGR